MSLGPSVALVAVGLAVAGGTSYVSLVHGGAHSRAPGPARVLDVPALNGATVNQFPDYLAATFASLPANARTAPIVTASLGPPASFADRFTGVVSSTYATSVAAAPTRSLTRPQVRVAKATPQPTPQTAARVRTAAAAAIRIDERAPAPAPRTYQLAAYAPTRDDTLAAPAFVPFRSDIRVPPLRQAMTTLVPFDSAPFPVRADAGGGDDKRVTINFRSKVRWERGAFSDPRVLLHIPKGFDPN
jgi:hypothetical protein